MKVLATLSAQNTVRGENILQFMTTAEVKPLEVGHQYVVTVQDANDKRTLNQNNLYWSIVGKIAKALNKSVAEIHNRTLIDCRIPWVGSDGNYTHLCFPDNGDDAFLERTDFHLAPTSQILEKTYRDKDGKLTTQLYRWFLLLLPSHLMNKEEMGRILDRIIQEAEDMGIHTEPELIQKAKENTNE